MKTTDNGASDDELAWRAHVRRAEKEVGAQKRRADLPFWRHVLVQISRASVQIAAICSLTLALLLTWMRSWHPTSWPQTGRDFSAPLPDKSKVN